ncbi:hypothetical protein SAMN05880582_1011234 [Rhizobium sp. RU20A]|uniref:hypothetical protein n=1 Tax=Rhizobium sp. RU20A TaxID=1907412 RepID=UPI0009551251|nr:hypothetical protein [Rhizobium sp. RU20A]SIQ24737.1 hypothetical protein SAMN05880582_1011234 [Rhizobium sp. RU20A]
MNDLDRLAHDSKFLRLVLQHVQQVVSLYGVNPRLYSVFASQQRWLMAQIGFSLHHSRDPADPATGLTVSAFTEVVQTNGVASRNTAASFLHEMLAYKFLRHRPDRPDRRSRPIEPTPIAEHGMWEWLAVHLATLDRYDGGKRCDLLPPGAPLVAAVQPRICDAILKSRLRGSIGTSFDLFTWANNGGVVLDQLFSLIEAFEPGQDRYTIGRISTTEMVERFLMSRTHFKRLILKAAEAGSVGWEGDVWRSPMWISAAFLREYWDYQAEKFAIIDQAFAAALAEEAPLHTASPSSAA